MKKISLYLGMFLIMIWGASKKVITPLPKNKIVEQETNLVSPYFKKSEKSTNHNMQVKQISLILAYFLLSTLSCQMTKPKVITKQNQSHPFENHLMPSIQVESESIFYNILERMKYHKVPGFSIAIIEDHQVSFAKGYGLSRKQEALKMDPHAIFQAGSISKPLTALIVLKLRDAGKLSLDNNIEDYLKNWQLPESKFLKNRAITVRMLLNHTAGINNVNSKGFKQNEPLPSLIEILNGQTNEPGVSLDTFPGIRHRYSNLGYAILQQIIEDIDGKPFEVVAQKLIFEPLKMTNSTFETVRSKDSPIQYCYSYNQEGAPNEGYWNNIVRKSSGGLYTTPLDLSKLCLAIQSALRGKEEFLSKETVMEIMNGTGYNLGFELKGKGATFSYTHSGRTPGYFAYMTMYPNSGKGVIISTNSDNGGALFKEVLSGFADLNSWDNFRAKTIQAIAIAPQQLNKYIGDYTLKLGGAEYTIAIRLDGKHLQYQMKGDEKIYPLRATSDHTFIDILEGETLEFVEANNKVQKLISNGEYEFLKQ